jgi:hypothetical protein
MNANYNTILNALQSDFPGASNRYVSFRIAGVSKEEIATVLSEHLDELSVGVNDFCGFHKEASATEQVAIWKGEMQDIKTLSKYFPDKLVVAESSWDYTAVALYKNGENAVPMIDYQMELFYEENEEEEDYYDTRYTITDDTYRQIAEGGAGMVYKDDFVQMRVTATAVTEGHVYENTSMDEPELE